MSDVLWPLAAAWAVYAAWDLGKLKWKRNADSEALTALVLRVDALQEIVNKLRAAVRG